MNPEKFVYSILHQVGKGFVAEVVLNRPKALNALSTEMFKELQTLYFLLKREKIFIFYSFIQAPQGLLVPAGRKNDRTRTL